MKPLPAALSLVVSCALIFESAAEERPDGISLRGIVADLNREHPEEIRDQIFKASSKPILMQLRVKYDLWNNDEKSPERLYFESKGIDHPDAISGCIFEAWSLSHQGIDIDEESFLRKNAEIHRDRIAWNEENEREAMAERDPFPPRPILINPFEPTENAGAPNDKLERKLSPQTVSLMIRGIDEESLQKQFLEPLDQVLREAGVGKVGVTVSDALGEVLELGFDIDLSDFERGMPILRKSLRDLAFPAGTRIDYHREGYSYAEYFKWHQRKARTE